MPEITDLPLRNEVPVHQTWDLDSLFPSVEAWTQGLSQVEAMLPELEAFRGRLSEGPAVVLACLQVQEKIYRLASNLFTYASLESSADSTNQAAQARAGQGRMLFARVAAAGAFFEPELLALGLDTLRGWLSTVPEMAYLAHYFDRLEREQAHLRSAEVEQVLAMVSDPLGSSAATYGMLANADLKFAPARDSQGKSYEVGQSSIDSLIAHEDREVRRTAWENYADGYLAFKNTLANTQLGGVKRDVFFARVRNYRSALEASLSPNAIPTEVFHNLINVFKKFLPTWHKYWRIRRQAMGYDSFHVYDIKAPLAAVPVVVPYEQAVDWIAAGMQPLGEEYVSVLRKGCLADRWVDYARNKGKRQGAFSSGTYDSHPFIMMSYADNLYSLSTLAHELGHSMHSYYSRKTQPFIYSRYSLFEAEVASNFNQAMVRDYLFKTQSSRDFQIGLIEEAMSNFHRYFFIMPTLARFELEIHERVERGASLNADGLIKLTADLFKEGYGEEVVFDHDRIGITWAQFGHMYMNFYVYQYATGISGAHALADSVLANEPGAVDRYLNFLKSGGSQFPPENLKRAGVDLTSPEPVEKAFHYLDQMVDRLGTLIGE